MFYILLFLILALPGGLLPPREKQKKRKAEGLLTDDEFVQLKKRKAELEIDNSKTTSNFRRKRQTLKFSWCRLRFLRQIQDRLSLKHWLQSFEVSHPNWWTCSEEALNHNFIISFIRHRFLLNLIPNFKILFGIFVLVYSTVLALICFNLETSVLINVNIFANP